MGKRESEGVGWREEEREREGREESMFYMDKRLYY